MYHPNEALSLPVGDGDSRCNAVRGLERKDQGKAILFIVTILNCTGDGLGAVGGTMSCFGGGLDSCPPTRHLEEE